MENKGERFYLFVTRNSTFKIKGSNSGLEITVGQRPLTVKNSLSNVKKCLTTIIMTAGFTHISKIMDFSFSDVFRGYRNG